MRPTRMITLDDAPAIAELLRVNREFLAPFEPERDEDYFTASGQREVIRALLDKTEQGTTLAHVILDESGRPVGRITLNEILRGPLQSCRVGYWLNAADNGRGLATAALHEMMRIAFDELALHRLEAGTRLDNVASQRVLERAGFVRYGVAPSYLHVAGEWRDHALYQRVSPADRLPW